MIAPARLRVAALGAVLAACASAGSQRPPPALWTPQSDAPSALTQEVTGFLGLREVCAGSWRACAEAVERAPGPLQPATRAVTAAEAWFYAGAGSPRIATRAYLRCAESAAHVLFDPELPGRSPALLAPTQRAFRLYNECAERWLAAASGARGGRMSLAAL